MMVFEGLTSTLFTYGRVRLGAQRFVLIVNDICSSLNLIVVINAQNEVSVKVYALLIVIWLSSAIYMGRGSSGSMLAPSQLPGNPTPLNAVEAIIKVFDQAPLVGCCEIHGLQEQADFTALLIRHPAFSTKVNDIVVEFGNALYQDVMDRYIAGKDVSPAELRQIWRNTTQLLVWNAPIYEKFFANVRELNQTLPASRRLRVLLGDPPIDWNKVQGREDIPSFNRDQYYAKIVEDEVLAKGRKALLIVGSGHLARQSIRPPEHAGRLIEKRHPKSLFVIIPHIGFQEQNAELELRLASWPKPSLVFLKGTWLGALDASLVIRLITSPDGGKCWYSLYGETKLEEAVDAYLYLGPSDTLTRSIPSPDIYRDEAYLNELKRRHKIMGRDFDPLALLKEPPKKFDYKLPYKVQKKCP
jgi:hypothetical protein